jgi:flagellin-like hook-associated protein FlgL
MQTALTALQVAAKQELDRAIAVHSLRRHQTQDQKNMVNMLDSLVGMLNTAADGRYLFSGRAVDQEPVASTDQILNGSGVQAGLKQVIDERRQADLGTTGLGRLIVGAPSPTSVSLDEDAVSPFGFKLVGATTAIAGATVSPPAGAPASMSVDLGPTNPNPGDTIKFSFTLPDGSKQDLTLTATNASPPAARSVHDRRYVRGHRDQFTSGTHSEPRNLGEHPAGGRLRGPGRQRVLQHRRQPPAAAR